MSVYLRLVAQPMQVRFEFRKARKLPGSATAPESGSLYVILSLHSTHYGPYATGIKCARADWNNRRTARPSAEVKELNREIARVQAEYETAHARLSMAQRETGSPAVIDGPGVLSELDLMRSGPVAPVTLARVYDEFYASRKQLVEYDRRKRREGQISLGTLKTYPKRWVLIQQFLIATAQPRIAIQNVTYPMATALKEWMQGKVAGGLRGSRSAPRFYDQATVHKVIGLLKMLLTYAQSRGYILLSPLATFSCAGGSKAKPRPLTEAQMDRLETCDLPPVLRYQCDSWLVAAELCLHHADYMQLPGMKLITTPGGNSFIQHERAKQTGSSLIQTVNLTPRVHRMIERYGGLQHLYYGSSAYFSKVLKRIARLADLRDESGKLIPLQFGQGRDTGLTSRAVQGANPIQLSEMAGWADPRQARRYIGNAVAIVEGFVGSLPAVVPTGPAPESDEGH